MTCSSCADHKDVERLPRGWKRSAGDTYCKNCWRSKRVLRAVTFPVVGPVEIEWPALRAILREQWGQTTAISNWLMTELYAADTAAHAARAAGAAKLPASPRTYFYPKARKLFPLLEPRTVSAIEQQATAKYRSKRFDVVWRHAASLPVYRYPTPLPVPSQAWRPTEVDGRPAAQVRIGQDWITLRLKGGSRFRRQIESFNAVLSGQCERGELALYQNGKHLMCKIVAWLPKKSHVASGTLFARSAADSLLIAINEKDQRLWACHADQLPRWAAEHRDQLQRWADDSKAELRPTPPFTERRRVAARKYRMRLASAGHEIAAQLVGYAVRRKFAALRVDLTERSFCPDFPWYALGQRLTEKCDLHGIALNLIASAEATPEMPEPLASEATDAE